MRTNSRTTTAIWAVTAILCISWGLMSARIFNDVVLSLIVGIVGALVISMIGRMIIRPMERRALARMYEENESERV